MGNYKLGSGVSKNINIGGLQSWELYKNPTNTSNKLLTYSGKVGGRLGKHMMRNDEVGC
jgi:hypothetical protein